MGYGCIGDAFQINDRSKAGLALSALSEAAKVHADLSFVPSQAPRLRNLWCP
jgi:hypothetical protein